MLTHELVDIAKNVEPFKMDSLCTGCIFDDKGTCMILSYDTEYSPGFCHREGLPNNNYIVKYVHKLTGIPYEPNKQIR